MTGGGFRSFTAGEVLTAANVQDFFMDQAVMNFAGTAARASAIPTPSAGMVTHIGGGTVQVYNGTAWVALGGVPNAVLSNTPSGTYSSGGTSYAFYEFTASGTATVTTAGFADVLVVGGGGSGGAGRAGGGGAGGHLEVTNAYLPSGSLTVTVGAGGASVSVITAGINGSLPGRNGNASRLGSYFSPGGGAGAGYGADAGGVQSPVAGFAGGSGGGSSSGTSGSAGAGGSGVTSLGNSGGNGSIGAGGTGAGGGGGGAGAAGSNASSGTGGNGGNGVSNSYTGSAVTRAGGGGGAGPTAQGTGGSGGGGAASDTGTATSGTANTGGGGGAGNVTNNSASGAGGSGIVIIRVRT